MEPLLTAALQPPAVVIESFAVETGPVADAICSHAVGIGLTAVGIGSSAVAMGFSAVGFRPLAVGIGSGAVGVGSPAVAIGSPAVGIGLTAVAIGLGAVGVRLGAVAFVSRVFTAFCAKPASGSAKLAVSGIASTRAGRARHSVRAVFPMLAVRKNRRAGDCPPYPNRFIP